MVIAATSTRLGLLTWSSIAWSAFCLMIPSISLGAPFRIGVMGDSFSAGSGVSGGGTPNWVSQFRSTGEFTFQNKASGGASSQEVVDNQLASIVALAASGQIDASVFMIGGNDFTAAAEDILINGNAEPYVDLYVANVKTILDSIALANPAVEQVYVTLPDITASPLVAQLVSLGVTLEQVQYFREALQDANSQATTYALSQGIPVVDLFNLTNYVATHTPFTLGGYTYATSITTDGIHPAAFLSGLMGNTIMTAMNLGYGNTLLQLSDQKIVQNTGRTPNGLTTYFDVTPYVILPVPEVPSVVVIGAVLVTTLSGFRVRHRQSRDSKELAA